MDDSPKLRFEPKRVGRYAGVNLRASESTSKSLLPTATPDKRRGKPIRRYTPVPVELQNDAQLASDCSALPSNYSFEIAKTVHRARETNARRLALQLPEGLLLYATTISDIIRRHTSVTSTLILGDVTYGACCIDDLSAMALSADLLVHYGHSCLVPVSTTLLPTLYVFVHIAFDTSHLINVMRANFERHDHITLVGTIQFVDTIHQLRDDVSPKYFDHLTVPQKRPLSPGELLGCTSPQISTASSTSTSTSLVNESDQSRNIVLYIADGRFHLESSMIANPHLTFYRYDPYSKKLTSESYATDMMHATRKKAIAIAKEASNFGVILGTLGRQGSPAIMKRILKALRETNRNFFVLLLSELTPAKLKRLENGCGVQAWVQIACPRLSIDWGDGFCSKPLLTPYECFVALGKTQWRDTYPMDYYAKDGGEWSNYYKENKGKLKQPLRSAVST